MVVKWGFMIQHCSFSETALYEGGRLVVPPLPSHTLSEARCGALRMGITENRLAIK